MLIHIEFSKIERNDDDRSLRPGRRFIPGTASTRLGELPGLAAQPLPPAASPHRLSLGGLSCSNASGSLYLWSAAAVANVGRSRSGESLVEY